MFSGEYTFDFRNESLQEWFINGYMISDATLAHKPHAIGLGWMDDRITMEGMSEQGSRADFLNDTGLSKAEMTELVAGYQATMKRLNAAVHAEGGFTWMLIKGKGPQVRPMPDRHNPGQNLTVNASTCTAILREYCVPEPAAWRQASMYLLQAEWEVKEQAEQTTAEFLVSGSQCTAIAPNARARQFSNRLRALPAAPPKHQLTRGDYAWIGWGWSHPELHNHYGLPRAENFDVDYGGKASAPCAESAASPGVFTRKYPKATITWDCHAGRGSIEMTRM